MRYKSDQNDQIETFWRWSLQRLWESLLLATRPTDCQCPIRHTNTHIHNHDVESEHMGWDLSVTDWLVPAVWLQDVMIKSVCMCACVCVCDRHPEDGWLMCGSKGMMAFTSTATRTPRWTLQQDGLCCYRFSTRLIYAPKQTATNGCCCSTVMIVTEARMKTEHIRRTVHARCLCNEAGKTIMASECIAQWM